MSRDRVPGLLLAGGVVGKLDPAGTVGQPAGGSARQPGDNEVVWVSSSSRAPIETGPQLSSIGLWQVIYGDRGDDPGEG
jgi:hypothetical protein